LALCELIGVVGTKYLIEQVNTLIFENIIKIKTIVSQNKEVLQSLRINFDRPDMMKDLYKRLESMLKIFSSNLQKIHFIIIYVFKDVDLALVSLLNIGIYLSFKNLLSEALIEVMEKRLPFLILSAQDFSKNYGDHKFEIVS
jgi:NCK-associated protein 1